MQRHGSEQYENDGGRVMADALVRQTLQRTTGAVGAHIAGRGVRLRLMHGAHDSLATVRGCSSKISYARQDGEGQRENSQNGGEPSQHARLC